MRWTALVSCRWHCPGGSSANWEPEAGERRSTRPRRMASGKVSTVTSTICPDSTRGYNQIFLGLFAQEAEDLNITPAQFGALLIVAHHPGLDQTRLTELLALGRSSATKRVDRLEERGLISRRVSAEDRRVRLLEITPAGAELLETARECVQRTGDRLLAPLGEEASQLITLLEKVADTLNKQSRVPMRE